VCLWIPPINFRMNEQIIMKLDMYIMASEPVLKAYLVKPCYKSVCLYVHPSTVTRQRLSKNFTSETNAHATIEENFGRVIFYPVRVVSKVNRRLVLLRTSCFMWQYVRPWTNIKWGTQFSRTCTSCTYRICLKIEMHRRVDKTVTKLGRIDTNFYKHMTTN
jgi:hypothetical protein